MKLTSVDNILDKTLAMPIYSSNGNILINTGCVCTEGIIKNLKNNGINIVYTEDTGMETSPQEMIDISLRFKFLKLLKIEFYNVRKGKMPSDKVVDDIIRDIINNINMSENAFLFNTVSHLDDDIKFCNHALDVALLSIKFGLEKRFDRKKINNLGYAALFHDVGQLFVSEDHCAKGYELVKLFKSSSITIYRSIYEHHEFEDGSGFPRGIKGDSIYELSKIINICNIYVNSMDFQLPSEVIEKLTALAVSKIDKDLYKHFINSTYIYPNGLTVTLNNGMGAMVVKQNTNFPSRPIVGIIVNNTPRFIDLLSSSNQTIFIKKVAI